MNALSAIAIISLAALLSAAGVITGLAAIGPSPSPHPTVQVITPSPRTVAAPTAEPTVAAMPRITPASAKTPEYIEHDVAFTSQAPTGNWSDLLYQDGCEEASILMAMRWLQRKTVISAQEALAEIKNLSDFNHEHHGFYLDVSAQDTARLLREYYQHSGVKVRTDVSAQTIRQELTAGNVIIVPVNGRQVPGNHYTPPGPERHMILLIGYDDRTGEIITNDPGTKFGSRKRYDIDGFVAAIRDYPSGFHVPITKNEKAMVVVSK